MYCNDYKTIKKFVNKSGIPRWIQTVLLKDDEFLRSAQEIINLHRLNHKYPLKRSMKDLIKEYKKQAILSQFYVQRVRKDIYEKIYYKIGGGNGLER